MKGLLQFHRNNSTAKCHINPIYKIAEDNIERSETKRGKVIDYENSVRNILGLPKIPYDLYHLK